MKYLLDSTVLIDFLNRVSPAAKWLESVKPADIAISVITCAEVFCGCENQQEFETAHDLLEQYPCLDITWDIAKSAAQMRRQFGWKLPDAFQATLSIEHQLVLITRNVKDFDPSIHKFVKIPYQLQGK
ncbi:MAG: type II toxin-antitoxin system VapC family toxin [Candidatus Omnitrophica bacterium]|nr:type II toxin-antitoxin system VapC family toxin [Candidatus Omnitrophota bacterium]